jgi:hypothetical protein
MNRNNAVNRQFTKLLIPLAISFVSVFQCHAQSQDQAGTARKPTGKDEIIACRFSVLGVIVDVAVKDQKGNVVPNLRMKNFLVYEDGVEQDILSFMQIGVPSNGKYSLYYEPANVVFDGKRRGIRIEVWTPDGRKLRISSRIRLDPNDEFSFKVGVYPQGYSIREAPHKKQEGQ